MQDIATVAKLRAWVAAERAAGRRIGLVPTMGFLHEGHLRLVDEACRRADAVVLSIFVNPLQFAPGEDLTRYPRDLARDRSLAAGRGVDRLFVPSSAIMYPAGSDTRVSPGAIGDRWEGAARPGHFTGVLTVVAKLFHLAQPDIACFGQKDIQQATLVRRMVADLDWPIELAVVPIVREPDGLALSSRNVFLSEAARADALALSRALAAAERAWRGGERAATALDSLMRGVFERVPGVAVDYIAICDAVNMLPVDVAVPGTIIAVAARVGGTRLIDNVILGEERD